MSNCLSCGGTECFCRFAREIKLLREACQIFTGALGNEEGYIPAIGATKTARALECMRSAGVKPVFYGEWREREKKGKKG